MPNDESNAGHPQNPAARLRKIGLVVLLSGLVIAGLVYLFGTGNAPPDENTLQTQYYKQQEVEVQKLWGNGGSLVLGITRSLKQASTYSVIILALSILVALACFYLASHPQEHGPAKDHSPRS